jgi:hypothetical protein
MSGQRGFVEAAQQQALLAWVSVDVAHGVNARRAALERGGRHAHLFAFQTQAPLAERPQLGAHALAHQQVVHRHVACHAVRAQHAQRRHPSVLHDRIGGHAHHQAYLLARQQVAHLCIQFRLGLELVASVQQGHA